MDSPSFQWRSFDLIDGFRLESEQVGQIGLKTEFLVNSILSRPRIAQRFPPFLHRHLLRAHRDASLFNALPLKPPRERERKREKDRSSSFFPLAKCLRNFVPRLSLLARCPCESFSSLCLGNFNNPPGPAQSTKIVI